MARHEEYDDDRMVVVERDSGSSAMGMLLLGLAVGAGAALLFAPASGEETRARLQEEARRAGRRVKDMTDELGEEMTDRVERTRSAIDSRVGRARDAVSSRARAVGEAAAVGRDAALQARMELERAVADSKRAYADSRRAYRDARTQNRTDSPDLEQESSGGTPGEG
jgi:gas vesicle protein